VSFVVNGFGFPITAMSAMLPPLPVHPRASQIGVGFRGFCFSRFRAITAMSAITAIPAPPPWLLTRISKHLDGCIPGHSNLAWVSAIVLQLAWGQQFLVRVLAKS
jgi:hypothetical protein